MKMLQIAPRKIRIIIVLNRAARLINIAVPPRHDSGKELSVQHPSALTSGSREMYKKASKPA